MTAADDPDAAEVAALDGRLRAVRDELAVACRRAGRAPDAARLVVVTKAAPPTVFASLRALGVEDVGENRVQDAEARLAGRGDWFRWHFIGHLQSNKVRKAVPLFDVFHGVDSRALMERIDRVAGEAGRRPELFLQVNVSGEASKSGLDPAALGEVVEAGDALRHARLTGLMTMAPRADDPEEARPVFAALAALLEEHGRAAGRPALRELSMGMTEDFGVAAEEGATWVRVGRRLVAPPVRDVD